MAITPGEYNFTLQRRSDWSLSLQFKDSTQQAMNLIGYEFDVQAWDRDRSVKYADFTVTEVNLEQGKIDLSLSAADTAGFPDEVFYDVLLSIANNNGGKTRTYFLKGQIQVEQGYSEP